MLLAVQFDAAQRLLFDAQSADGRRDLHRRQPGRDGAEAARARIVVVTWSFHSRPEAGTRCVDELLRVAARTVRFADQLDEDFDVMVDVEVFVSGGPGNTIIKKR